MKQVTLKIIENFPALKQVISHVLSGDEKSDMNLSDTENVFLGLALFFEDPNSFDFCLSQLFNLDSDWLVFALELIILYLKENTYLVKDTNISLIKETDYFNQSHFAEFLRKNGLQYTRHKLHTYLKRGKIPNPDVILDGSKYWYKETAKNYLLQEGKKNKTLETLETHETKEQKQEF